ncbi:aminopeptidase [Haploplasma axanthum]|uniref:Aminopeptidase 2 n=1 Tax=Haploplasma axanthum TaxID=29552 RepID=A0A449BE14_HAPAX|nr:aminopeptidase [Haploplasma axanthum]VEU80550.1 Aminopeptidase 2 [Haploplasma axanthum]
MLEKLIQKYAELTVKIGVNVQKDQIVVIRSTTETKEFARALTKEAYLVGAKKVYVQWSDDYVGKYTFEHATLETLKEVEQWSIDQTRYFVDENACFISITSPIPGLNAGLDGSKIQASMAARQKAIPFYQAHMMANKTQWVVVGAPNQIWAEKVFPELKGEKAVEALWTAILNSARVYENNNPIADWEKHNKMLRDHNKILNDLNFKHLHFTNELGTDLIVELVPNHIWAGGAETSGKGVIFNPNIPTEESFTMPNKKGTRGKVFATKPLNYQGKLIEDFWLEFKDGKVVAFEAKKENDALKQLVNADEGSSYIGEIALISFDSPISNTNILFYNTLYDENASCHMALGRAYAMNVKGGTTMTQEELDKAGANNSIVHCDFMFGSKDLKIVGLTQDNKEVLVFENGNFVI